MSANDQKRTLQPLERDHSERFPDIPTLVQECYAGVPTLAEVATVISEIVLFGLPAAMSRA